MLDPYRFEVTHNGVSLLSSYWMTQEFIAEYPYNKSNVGGIVADTFINVNTKTFISEITSRGMDYIKQYYPVENFIDNTKLNLIVPIYANDGSIIKKFGYDFLDSNTQKFKELFNEEEFDEFDEFEEYDDEFLEESIDDHEVISFLTEYYMVNSKKLPTTLLVMSQ